jgi:hypothetical protein
MSQRLNVEDIISCVRVCVCVCLCSLVCGSVRVCVYIHRESKKERKREKERESCLLVSLVGSVRGRCQCLLFTYVCRACEGIYLCTAGRVVDFTAISS